MLLLFAVLPFFLNSATINVCSSCAPYTLTPAGWQRAMQDANCGDTVAFRAGGSLTMNTETVSAKKNCPPGNEIILDTDFDHTWLPQPGEKLTQAYKTYGLTPVINVVGVPPSNITLAFYETGATRKGYILRNLAWFWNNLTGTPATVGIAIGNPTIYLSADQNEYGGRVFMDHILITGSTSGAARSPIAPIRLNNNEAFSFTDSTAERVQTDPSSEGYIVQSDTNSFGLTKILNSTFSGCYGIGYFSGGNGGSIFGTLAPQASNILIENTIFDRPNRCFPNDPNYIGTLFGMKNSIECKECVNLAAHYNYIVRSGNGFGSQRFASTFSVRNGTNQCAGSISSIVGVTITITGYVPGCGNGIVGPVPGQGIGVCTDTHASGLCLPTGGFNYEWHKIVTVTGCTGGACQVTTDIGMAATGTDYAMAGAPWQTVRMVDFSNNLIDDTPNIFNQLGIDFFGSIQAAFPIATMTGFRVSSNLARILSPSVTSGSGVTFPANFGPGHFNQYGKDMEVSKNTYYFPNTGLSANFYNSTNDAVIADFDPNVTFGLGRNVNIHSNLFPSFIFFGWQSSGFTWTNTMLNRLDANSIFQNNSVTQGLNTWGVDGSGNYTPCAPGKCINNVFFDFTHWPPTYQDITKNLYVLTGTDYRGKGLNGTDIGANMQLVPLIYNVNVTGVTRNSFILNYSLAMAIKNSTCAVEVSPDVGLIDDTADYTLINQSRVDFWKRSIYDYAMLGSSTMPNPNKPTIANDGINRTWKFGGPLTPTGDDGNSHALALTSNTTYNYRLMCGGGRFTGSVTTLP